MKESMESSPEKQKSSGTQLFENSEKLTSEDIIGVGSEKVIYQHPEDPNKAIRKYTDEKSSSPERLKSDFYLSKILHLLYPKNFPDIYLSLPNYKIDMVEKIEKNLLADIALKPLLSLKTRYIANKLGVDIDSSGTDNFIVNDKLNAVYIDSPIGFNEEKIRNEILNKLKGEDQEQALKYLESYLRLQRLY